MLFSYKYGCGINKEMEEAGEAFKRLKYSSGSSNDTAKQLALDYIDVSKKLPLFTWQALYLTMLQNRIVEQSEIKIGNLLQEINPIKIVEYTEGDLRLFTYTILYLESAHFRNEISNNEMLFNNILVAILEVVCEINPSLRKISDQKYRKKASRFSEFINRI